jgi:hypothetical protein
MFGNARHAMLLYQLWSWVTRAWWSSVCFSLLTKFWTICKMVLSYIKSPEVFIQNHPLLLWFSYFHVWNFKFVQFCWNNQEWATYEVRKKSEWKRLNLLYKNGLLFLVSLPHCQTPSKWLSCQHTGVLTLVILVSFIVLLCKCTDWIKVDPAPILVLPFYWFSEIG